VGSAMTEFSFEPELNPKPSPGPIVQTITSPVGKLIWFAPAPGHGVVHVLHCHIDPAHQRRRHGTELFRQMQNQASQFFKSHGFRTRRIVVTVDQKSQINARAWLSKLGFHHIQTLQNISPGEDALVYLLGQD